MRILFETPLAFRGGTWFRCFYLARALVQRGHEVTLVKTSVERRLTVKAFEEDGVRVLETPRFWGWRFTHMGTRLPSDLAVRLGHLLGSRSDVVHSFAHHWNSAGIGLIARTLPWHGPLVADWDDLWTDGGLMGSRPAQGLVAKFAYDLDHAAEKRFKTCADAVTVVSQDLRRRAILDGVRAERILVLGNGAPIEEFAPGDKASLRRELDLPRDRTIAVFTGFGQYDLEQAFDALKLLDASGRAPYTVVTGPNEELVRGWVQERKLGHLVRVLGFVPFESLPALLAACDLGLVPYADKPINHARFPIKIGDYLAAGLPIAGSDVGEVGNVIRQYGAGVAGQPTVEGLAAAIDELANAPDLPARSARARAAAEKMSWPALAEQVERLYVSLAS